MKDGHRVFLGTGKNELLLSFVAGRTLSLGTKVLKQTKNSISVDTRGKRKEWVRHFAFFNRNIPSHENISLFFIDGERMEGERGGGCWGAESKCGAPTPISICPDCSSSIGQD